MASIDDVFRGPTHHKAFNAKFEPEGEQERAGQSHQDLTQPVDLAADLLLAHALHALPRIRGCLPWWKATWPTASKDGLLGHGCITLLLRLQRQRMQVGVL